MTGVYSLWQLLIELGGVPMLVALLLLYLMALTKGDPTDRACGHVLMIGAILFLLAALDPDNGRHSWTFGLGQSLTDLLILAALSAIAVSSSRRYPIIMAAAQLLIVLIGMLAVTHLIVQEKTLAAMIGAAASIQVGAFVVGLIDRSPGHRHGATATTTAD